MTERDYERFLAGLTLLAEVYGREISEPLARLYFECLRQYSLEEILTAFRAHITLPRPEGRFFPKPADIALLIEGDPDTKAATAWRSVCRAIEEHGRYASIAFDDPVVHMVIQEMGGWLKLCESKESELSALEKQFCKLYRYYSLHPREGYPAYFPGLIEADNMRQGFHDFLPPVVRWSVQSAKAISPGKKPAGVLTAKKTEEGSHDKPAGCRG